MWTRPSTLGPAQSLQHVLPSAKAWPPFTITITLAEAAPWASAPPPPHTLGRPAREHLLAGRNSEKETPCEPGWQAGPHAGGCPSAALAHVPLLPQTGLCRLPGAPMQQLHGSNTWWTEGLSHTESQQH